MSTDTPATTPRDLPPAVDAGANPNAMSPAASGSPFTDEREVLFDRVAIRDELSQAQASPSAARKLGGRHISRLIYSLEYAPGAVERHTAPYSIFSE